MRRIARRDERGAVALLVAALTSILMICAAFVIDLGMQRVARADLQALADVVALDLAREIDGRDVATLTPIMEDAMAASLARNESVIGDEPPELTFELGVEDAVAGDFTEITSGVPNGVRVLARTEVAYAFAPLVGKESGAAARSAVADSSSTACFRLGTFVAAIRAEDSTVLGPLNDLLGVNLDLVSYKALAAANLRLSQLVADTAIGSPEALLGGYVDYSTLLSVMANALRRENSPSNTVAISALTALSNSQVAAAVGAVRLGDVLHVAPDDRAALDIGLNVLDIVGSARLSDGKYFLGVPNIQGGVPGVGFQFQGGINLVSAAELACGVPTKAKADTAQLDGTLGITFANLPSLSLAGGLGTVQTPKGSGSLKIVAGSGTGVLLGEPPIYCGRSSAEDPVTFSVGITTGLASYNLTANVTVAGEVKVSALDALGLGDLLGNLLGSILGGPSKVAIEVEAKLVVGMTLPAGSEVVDLSVPPNDTVPVSTGGTVSLDPATVVTTFLSASIGGQTVNLDNIGALTALIKSALTTSSNGNDFLNKTIKPLVNNINNQYIGPVARMIGLRLAGADVYGVGVECGLPRLVG